MPSRSAREICAGPGSKGSLGSMFHQPGRDKSIPLPLTGTGLLQSASDDQILRFALDRDRPRPGPPPGKPDLPRNRWRCAGGPGPRRIMHGHHTALADPVAAAHVFLQGKPAGPAARRSQAGRRLQQWGRAAGQHRAGGTILADPRSEATRSVTRPSQAVCPAGHIPQDVHTDVPSVPQQIPGDIRAVPGSEKSLDATGRIRRAGPARRPAAAAPRPPAIRIAGCPAQARERAGPEVPERSSGSAGVRSAMARVPWPTTR